MTRQDQPPSSLHIFGIQSRFLRERRGLTQKELAQRITYSDSLIAMVERGERSPQPAYIERVDEALGANGMLAVLAPHMEREDHPHWAQEYVQLEAEALALHVYSTHVLHGLLQTEEYARAVFRSRCPALDEEDVERAVQARMERKLLTRRPPARLTFVLEESVLRRTIGGLTVRDGQLRQLLTCAALPHVVLQVMPDSRETHAGLDGPMTLLETPDHRTIAYVEGQRGSYFVSKPEEVSVITHRYGIIRSQALSPEESTEHIERSLAGES
ncbi:helix-turn-helix transcriptional regulator [Streptomyces sp. NPDC002055]|uniref:helix-turn-helix domain-containing protein n=1 Tax=Streptomyces sp. NPDC002055 TaxID=3154534 RepID=UPI00332BEA0C